MIFGLKKENFEYLKKQIYHGKVRKDRLFVFLKLKPGKREYRRRDDCYYTDATFEPSEVKEILTLSNGITLVDINRKKWKGAPEGYSFPEDLDGYVPLADATKNLSNVDRVLLEGVHLL